MTAGRAKRRERELLRRAKRGDPDARAGVVEAMLPVVRRVASRYRGLGMSVDDLVQEGCVGVLDAVDRFDPRRGTEFAVFARWRTRRAILNALTTQSRVVRLPKQVVERRRALAHARDRMTTAAHGRAPTLLDLAAATGLRRLVIDALETTPAAVASLETPAGDTTTLAGLTTDRSAPDPEREALAHEQTELVATAVEHLPDRQRFVIRRHYGFDCEASSLRAIADELQVSPQRVGALEQAALQQLEGELGPALGRDGRP